MLIQWLTFAVMILIHLSVAAWAVSAIKTTLTVQGTEIQNLRDWRHSLASKEMMIDQHGVVLADHEARIRVIEKEQTQADMDEKQALAIRALWAELNRDKHNGFAPEL